MKTLLVLSNANTHNTSKVKDKIKQCETALSVISSGLARILQSLYISINKMQKKVKETSK